MTASAQHDLYVIPINTQTEPVAFSPTPPVVPPPATPEKSKLLLLKKIIIPIIIIITLAVTGFIWLRFGNSLTKKLAWHSTITMRVPTTNWPGVYWMTIADAKGWFKEAGLNVTTVDVNSNYIQSLQDTVDGKLDTNSFTLFDLVNFNAKGAGLVMVIDADDSFGSDALVAKKEINSVADLKGKTIGVAKGFYSEYVLEVVLNQAGVPVDSVKIVDVQDEKSPEAFASGSFDAIETYQPYVDGVVKNGGHIIWYSSEVPGLIPSGDAFKQSFIDAHPKEMAAFVGVWNKTTGFIKSNPDDAFDIIAARYNSTRADIAAFAQTDKILNLEDNLTAFSYGLGLESLHGGVNRINVYLINHKMITKAVDSTEILNPQFVRELTE